MKKPALATMGVVGACAACCTIPLAIPLLSGLSIAGLATLNWGASGAYVGVIAAGVAASAAVGAGIWWSRRRKAAARCVTRSSSPAELTQPASGGCGCSVVASTKEAS